MNPYKRLRRRVCGVPSALCTSAFVMNVNVQCGFSTGGGNNCFMFYVLCVRITRLPSYAACCGLCNFLLIDSWVHFVTAAQVPSIFLHVNDYLFMTIVACGYLVTHRRARGTLDVGL